MSVRLLFGAVVTILLLSSSNGCTVAQEPQEIEMSVRVEPGVLAINAVAEKDSPTRLRFLEMYADEAAYNAHIQSPHFRKYFETTKDMIISRKLIDTLPVQVSAKQK